VTARDCIEHQQRLAKAKSTTLGGSQQRCTDAPPPCSSMHKHFREVPTVWLVLRLSPNDLHSTDDRSRCVFGNEHYSLAARHTRGHVVPERLCFGAGYWEHKTDGCPAFHAVDQHVA